MDRDEKEYQPDVEDFVSSQDCRECGAPASSNPHECEVCREEWDRASKAATTYYRSIENNDNETG